jgi:endonuclease IV
MNLLSVVTVLFSVVLAFATNDTSHQALRSEVAEIKKLEIAIIAPYRDLHKKQNRKQQLDKFIPAISEFMESVQRNSTYRIYIIEQSNDERKFNRGKLLNIGFHIASTEGCKALIFHDVDLIPSPGIFSSWYL